MPTPSRPDFSPAWLRPLALVVALGLPLVLGALLSWHSLGELDVWLHQATGREILHGDGFPRTNVFGFIEPDRPWTNHEWLFQVVVATTGMDPDGEPMAGVGRWNLLRLAMTLLLLGALVWGNKPWQASPRRMLALAPALVLGVSLLWPRLLLRPEILSYALLALVVRLAESPAASGVAPRIPALIRSRESWAFLLTLLWAQWHGFSSLAPLVWLLAGLLSLLPGGVLPRPGIGRWLLGVLILVGAQLLTPNGLAGLLYPLQALGQFSDSQADPSGTIAELVPLLHSPESLAGTILLFKISLVWGALLIVLGLPRLNILRILLWLVAAAAALVAQRNLGVYAVAFLLLNLDYLRPEASTAFRRLPAKLAPLALAAGLAAVGLSGWLGLMVVTDDFYLREGVSRRFGGGVTPGRYPFQCAESLARTPDLRVFANVDAAAFALDRAGVKVFIDGRTEAHAPERWLEYETLKSGGAPALDLLDRYRVQAALLTTGSRAFTQLTRTLLDSPLWSLVRTDEAGLLWSRVQAPSATSDEGKLRSEVTRLVREVRQSPLGNDTRQADRLAAVAAQAERIDHPDLVEELLRQGLHLRPDHPQLNHNLGNRLMAAGELSQAADHFLRALQTNPRLAATALNAGACYLRLERPREAVTLFRRAVDLSPDNARYRTNLGLALDRAGDREGALEELQRALDLDPANSRLRNLLQELRRSS